MSSKSSAMLNEGTNMRYFWFGCGAVVIALATFIVAAGTLPQPTKAAKIQAACIGEPDVEACEAREYAKANAKLMAQHQADVDHAAGN